MIPELFHQEAKDYLDAALPPINAKLELALEQDVLWKDPAAQELFKKFLSHFSFLGEEKASWLFMKSFNDAFVAEKNFITCPLW